MSDNPYRDEYERQRPRTATALIRVLPADSPHWVAKVLALLLLLLCVLLGLVGLILPVIPGLLFLAFGAMLAASMFPAFGRKLRTTPWAARFMTPYLDSAQGFSRLSWRGKLRFFLWMTCKVIVDTFVMLWLAVARLFEFLNKDKPRWD
ncbi:MAG: hypothetical protein V4603_18170 [Pseudomonadota bacterium]